MTQSHLQGLEEHWGQKCEQMARDASGGLLLEPVPDASSRYKWKETVEVNLVRQESHVKENMTELNN